MAFSRDDQDFLDSVDRHIAANVGRDKENLHWLYMSLTGPGPIQMASPSQLTGPLNGGFVSAEAKEQALRKLIESVNEMTQNGAQ